MIRSNRVVAFLALLFSFGAGTLWAGDVAVHGSLSTRYKFRAASGVHDNDIESLLSMDVGDPLMDKFSGSFQAGGIFDLDGKQTGSSLTSVYDNFNSENTERIYHAYVDANNIVEPLKFVRLGRQNRFEFQSLYFDGLYAEWHQIGGVTISTYGGVPVHNYETRLGHDSGDWLFGGALEFDPAASFKLRLDAVELKDSVAGFRSYVGDQRDLLLGSSMWWDVTPNIMLSTRFTSFTDEVRDLDVQSRFRFPEQNFYITANFFSLLHEQGVRVPELDFYSFIGSYEPYVEGGITLTKGLGEHFSVDGGFFMRKLIDQQIASAFNHGYQRFFLTGSVQDLPVQGLSMSVTGDYYKGTDNVLRDDVLSTSFDVQQQLMEKKVKVSGGTAYYLYRYNLLTGNESDNVRSFYARVSTKLIKSLEARLGYEYETSDLDNFHTVDTRVTWNF